MTEIRWPLTGKLIRNDSRDDLPIHLVYNDVDPWAVTFHFTPETKWLVARELLADGLLRPSGIGDVRIWPHPRHRDALCVHLRSPGGEALFEMPYAAVSQFLAATRRLVPPGGERMDFSYDELSDDC